MQIRLLVETYARFWTLSRFTPTTPCDDLLHPETVPKMRGRSCSHPPGSPASPEKVRNAFQGSSVLGRALPFKDGTCTSPGSEVSEVDRGVSVVETRNDHPKEGLPPVLYPSLSRSNKSSGPKRIWAKTEGGRFKLVTSSTKSVGICPHSLPLRREVSRDRTGGNAEKRARLQSWTGRGLSQLLDPD